MHVHVGVVEFLIFAAYYLVLKFTLRMAQLRFVESDSAFGRALAFLD